MNIPAIGEYATLNTRWNSCEWISIIKVPLFMLKHRTLPFSRSATQISSLSSAIVNACGIHN